MIKIEVQKVLGEGGIKALLITKASCLPADRLPKEYLELKEAEDIKITGRPEGILIEKLDSECRSAWCLLKTGLAYDHVGFLSRWEDIKKAGDRLTRIKKEIADRWEGELSFKY